VPKILQMFRRIKQSKSRRKAVSNAFKKVLGAEVIRFPREGMQRPEEARLAEEPPDYDTITRWLQLADEVLGNEGRASEEHGSEDRGSGWRGAGERRETRDRKQA
jgi:hypothetical protein